MSLGLCKSGESDQSTYIDCYDLLESSSVTGFVPCQTTGVDRLSFRSVLFDAILLSRERASRTSALTIPLYTFR